MTHTGAEGHYRPMTKTTKNKRTKKLRISKETLRTLSPADLRLVAGGGARGVPALQLSPTPPVGQPRQQAGLPPG